MNATIGAHKLANIDAARRFIFAGFAIFTVVNPERGTRLTLRFELAKVKNCECGPALEDGAEKCAPCQAPRPIFAAVLTGSDNESDRAYSYLGTVWDEGADRRYVHGKKSRIGADAPSAKAAAWVVEKFADLDAVLLAGPAGEDAADNLADALAPLARVEFFHEGRCGRCGHRLTVPESIETGLGPVCAEKAGL